MSLGLLVTDARQDMRPSAAWLMGRYPCPHGTRQVQRCRSCRTVPPRYAHSMSFTCPACQTATKDADDERYGWCSRCHAFTGDHAPAEFKRPARVRDALDVQAWNRASDPR